MDVDVANLTFCLCFICPGPIGFGLLLLVIVIVGNLWIYGILPGTRAS